MTRDAAGPGRGGPLAVLLAGQFMANVDTAIVNVAAPSVQADLRASPGQVTLVVSGYTLTYAVLLVTGARLGETHGHRRVFLWGLLGFVLASLGCGTAPGPVVLVASRMVQGAASALMVPQVLSCVQTCFSGRDRSRALGYYSLALSGGAVAGQVLGGPLVSADILGSGWRPVFLINVPLGCVLLVAGRLLLPPDAAGPAHAWDVRGLVALATAVGLTVVPVVLGRDAGWPLWSLACLVASPVVFLVFLRVERRLADRGGRPLVRLETLTRPPVRRALLAHALTTLTYLSLLFVLAAYLQRGLGQSPTRAGLAMVAWVAAFGVAGPVLPRLPKRARRGMPMLGCLLLAVGYAAVAGAVAGGDRGGPLLWSLLGVGGLGLGLGVSSQALITHLTSVVPAGHAADLSGVISTNAQLSGTIGVAVCGSLYTGLSSPPGTARAAFTTVTAVFTVLSLLAAVAARRATHGEPVGREVTPEAVGGRPFVDRGTPS